MKYLLLLNLWLASGFFAAAQQNPVNYFEDFSKIDEKKWPSVKNGDKKYYQENGVYIIDLTGEKGWAVSPHYTDIIWDDLTIELTVNALMGNSKDIGAGMLIGDINNNTYRFVITTDGRYGFGIYQEAGFNWIKPFTASPAILKGNNLNNVLKVEIKNNYAKLSINNNQVDNIRLSTPLSGDQVSMYAGNGQKTAFDNFRVKGFAGKKNVAVPVKENVKLNAYNKTEDLVNFLYQQLNNKFPAFKNKLVERSVYYNEQVSFADQASLGIIKTKIYLKADYIDFSNVASVDYELELKNITEANRLKNKMLEIIETEKFNERLNNMSLFFPFEPFSFKDKRSYAIGNNTKGYKGDVLSITVLEGKDFLLKPASDAEKGFITISLLEPEPLSSYFFISNDPANDAFHKTLRNIVEKMENNSIADYKTGSNNAPNGLMAKSFDSKIKIAATKDNSIIIPFNNEEHATYNATIIAADDGMNNSSVLEEIKKWKGYLSAALGMDYIVKSTRFINDLTYKFISKDKSKRTFVTLYIGGTYQNKPYLKLSFNYDDGLFGKQY